MQTAKKKIPLAERLRMLGDSTALRFKCFELFVDDFYLQGLLDLTGINCWETIYHTQIKPYNRERADSVITEIVAKAMSLPETEKANLLYRLLIEPFVYIQMADRRD